MLDIDAVYSEIGDLGPQQVRYAVAFLLLSAYASWHMLQFTFVGYAIKFECYTADQDTPYYNVCPANAASKCQKITFSNIEAESTIVSEWNLVCDREWMAGATMSAFMAGVMIGAPLLGSASDAIGRRKTLGVCLTAVVFLNGFSAVAPSYALYVALKFCVGFFQGGFIIAMFVLCNELIGASKRGHVSNGLQCAFAVGIMLYSFSAYHCRHWRSLTLLVTLVGSPLILYYFYLPESPRWLQSRGRTREAVAVVKKIAAGNGRKFSGGSGATLDEEASGGGSVRKIENGDSVMDLLRQPALLPSTLIQMFSWFVNGVTYYGLTIAASSAEKGEEGDRYMSTAISGAVEIPSYVLTFFLLAYLGRRLSLCAFMLSGGGALLLVAVASSFQGIVNALGSFGKFCIAASFSIVYIHSGEIFPTSVRNSAMGVVAVTARIGGIIAPMMTNLKQVAPNLHLIVFGALAFSAGVLNLRLPDTSGLPLPESLSDMRRLLTNKVARDAAAFSKRAAASDRERLLDDEEEDGVGFESTPPKKAENFAMGI